MVAIGNLFESNPLVKQLIYLLQSSGYITNIEISGTTSFENNTANSGAAFHAFLSTISIIGTLSMVNNTANLGAVGIVHSTAIIRASIIYSGNIGSFFVYSGEVSTVPFYNGKTLFFPEITK